MIKKTLFSLLFALLLLPATTATVQAAQTGVAELKGNLGAVGVGTGLGTPDDADLKSKVANVINIVLGFLGILSVIYIIYAGFKWIMAEGNDEIVKEAKSSIKNAVIGLIVVFASYVVVNFAVTQLSRATGGAEGGGSAGGRAGGGGGCNTTCTYNSDEGVLDFTCDPETQYGLTQAECDQAALAANCDDELPTWVGCP